MEPKNLAELNKVMLNAMHEMFTTGMNAMNTMQTQAEMVVRALKAKNLQTYNLSEGVMDEWLNAVKSGQDEFRKIVDDSFTRAETHLKALMTADGKGEAK